LTGRRARSFRARCASGSAPGPTRRHMRRGGATLGRTPAPRDHPRRTLSTLPCQTPAVPPSLSRILDARGAQRVALSPDGGTLYFVTDLTGTMQLWSLRLGDGPALRLSYECDRVGAYRVSPDGRAVVTTNRDRSDHNHLTLVAPEGSSRRLTPDEPEAMYAAAHAFDGGVLAVSDRGRDLAGVARVGLDGSFAYVVERDRE